MTITLKDVRDQLSELISRVVFGQQKVVITRFGKPVATLVAYKDYEKIMNPYKRFSKEEWEKGFALMDKMRTNTKKFNSQDVEEAIEKAVKNIRQKKRV